MKKIFSIIAVVGTLGLLMPACSLDKFPTDRVVLENAFETFLDAERFNNGLYSELRRSHHSVATTTTEIMSDLFNAHANFGNRGGFPHRLNTELAGGYEVRDIWGNVFASIFQVNHFLDNIGNVSGLTTAQEATAADFIAEAHYMRAFFYTLLAGHYMYPMTTANRNTPELGLPLITTADIQIRAGRSTIGETFDLILSDIEAAKNVSRVGVPGAIRVSQDAVNALAARVHFMMGNNTLAAQYANAVIATGRYPLITTESALRAMWREDVSTENIFALHVTTTAFGTAAMGAGANFNDPGTTSTWTSNPAHLGAVFTRVNTTVGGYDPDFIPTQTVIDLYDANDIRLNVFFSNPAEDDLVVGTSAFSGIRVLYKFRGNRNFTVNHLQAPIVHRIAEMYLIAAEAEQNLARLNELRVARGLTALGAWNEQELRDEWVREFIGEGFRIQGLRRWGIGFNGRVPQNPATVANYGSTEFTNRNVTPDQFFFFTLPIPSDELRNNPNMRQTPSWDF